MLYPVSLFMVVIAFGYLLLTFALARKKKALPVDGFEPRRFVFMVPALNEELVIGSTVDSLLAACTDEDRVLVIDDGSTDATADLVRSRMADPRVLLYQRTLPDAKVGKGKALNAAYRYVRDLILAEGLDASDVVLCIVDADGRVESSVLDSVAPYFRDARVGAVQLLVRIRNRDNWLCRFQDYDFLLFSALTQTAREKLGSVGLGGNGQFTRLSALIGLGDDPWSECLTEDLDLGVRLAIAGWMNRFCGETFVDQQGLSNLRLLIRQRTRWAQGHFQCWKLIPAILRSHMPTVTAYDMCYYLLSPGLVMLSPILFTATFGLFALNVATHPTGWLNTYGLIYGLVEYVLAFGPSMYMAILYWRRSRDLSLVAALVLGHMLSIYNYIWYIAEYKAMARILLRRNGWAKTARTAEDAGAPLSEEGSFWGTEDSGRVTDIPIWRAEDTWQAQSAYAAYREKHLAAPVPAAPGRGEQGIAARQPASIPTGRPTGHFIGRPTDYVLRDNYDETPTQFIRALPPVPPPRRP